MGRLEELDYLLCLEQHVTESAYTLPLRFHSGPEHARPPKVDASAVCPCVLMPLQPVLTGRGCELGTTEAANMSWPIPG
jgi:hypothetical protein